MSTRLSMRIGFWVLLLWSAGMSLGGEVIYVDGICGQDDWNGTSLVCSEPNGPKETIQGSIDVVGEGDTIIVGEWTYYENISFNGTNITLRSTDPADAKVVESSLLPCQT